MLRMKAMSPITIIAAALLISGCVNLKAVREFAATSADLTDYKAVTARYATSAERQLQELPAHKRFDATRSNLQKLQAVTAQDKVSLLKLHAATTGYMAALAALAGDDAYSLSAEIDQVSGAIAASDQLKIDATHVQAYGNIVKKVVSWIVAAEQARDVKNMVRTYGADMDKLLEAMQVATQTYGFVLEQEAATSAAVAAYREAHWDAPMPGDINLTPGRREVVATLLRRSNLAQETAQAEALRSQKAAAAGLAEVREAHRALLINIDRLKAKDVQALLKKATSDLKSIRKSLATL